MSTSILSIGQSALAAAQAGLDTTGHNIANAFTPGYSRQLIIQASAGGQDTGLGFLGKGTSVVDVRRVFSDFLNTQVLTAQTSKSGIDSYYAQLKGIDNMLADTSAGLSPAIQDFFRGVQTLSSDPNSAAARQSLLSSAETLAARFQSLSGQLEDLRQGVNQQITSTVGTINGYATQIANLNDAIAVAQAGASGKAPNDLLDQRDQVINDLSKEVKVSVVKQGDVYNVFIGNGQPLVVNTTTYGLTAVTSPTDPTRTEVGYTNNGVTTVLSENSLMGGGTLSGVLDFRANSLDLAQNSLGRVAIGLADTFNAQHKLGQTQTGAMGGAFFSVGSPVVVSSSNNTGAAVATATISNAGALTTSDYRLQYDGVNYNVTRLSDGAVTTFAAFPQTIDGVDFDLTAGAVAGDTFMIRPTVAGAAGFNVAITDKSEIAAAAPIRTAVATTNFGIAQISAGSVDATYTAATVTPPVTMTYNAATNELTGFPALMPVTVTTNGVATVFAAGAPVTYTSGSTISFGGASFTITGAPGDGDTFTIGPNTNGLGDNRNALLLGALQSANTLANGTTSYQGAYAQLVNLVGNKTNELKITGSAADKLLTQAVASQQSESGVNLDEEATNLLRYQQAYQAAGKVMQTASTLFDVLLSLGH